MTVDNGLKLELRYNQKRVIRGFSGRVNYYVNATGAPQGSIQHVNVKATIAEVRPAAFFICKPLACLSIKRNLPKSTEI